MLLWIASQSSVHQLDLRMPQSALTVAPEVVQRPVSLLQHPALPVQYFIGVTDAVLLMDSRSLRQPLLTFSQPEPSALLSCVTGQQWQTEQQRGHGGYPSKTSLGMDVLVGCSAPRRTLQIHAYATTYSGIAGADRNNNIAATFVEFGADERSSLSSVSISLRGSSLVPTLDTTGYLELRGLVAMPWRSPSMSESSASSFSRGTATDADIDAETTGDKSKSHSASTAMSVMVLQMNSLGDIHSQLINSHGAPLPSTSVSASELFLRRQARCGVRGTRIIDVGAGGGSPEHQAHAEANAGLPALASMQSESLDAASSAASYLYAHEGFEDVVELVAKVSEALRGGGDLDHDRDRDRIRAGYPLQSDVTDDGDSNIGGGITAGEQSSHQASDETARFASFLREPRTRGEACFNL